ncbi:MAG: hypothetical protein QOJ56_3735 [Mycobacterium sp.]|nr:hypothetical protein [Mycobacterium sp.]
MLRFGPLVPGLNSGDDGVGVGSADAIEDDRSAVAMTALLGPTVTEVIGPTLVALTIE